MMTSRLVFAFAVWATSSLAQTIIAPLNEDTTAILDVVGEARPNKGWKDSYSVGDRCYCNSTFDHKIGIIEVETPIGPSTVREVCDMLGPGPGSEGRPIYNDIQCGHGPPNNYGDEQNCPGRVDHGTAGCGYIGPKWNFEDIIKEQENPGVAPLSQDLTQILDIPGLDKANKWWIGSYSVGDKCYCDTDFAKGIGEKMVSTARGIMTVREACELVGPGPGKDGNPQYNTVQCGHGPTDDSYIETNCPGRIEYGAAGCGHIGPKFKIKSLYPGLKKDNTEILSIEGLPKANVFWADSYSVGDSCYCDSKLEDGVGELLMDTPMGTKTVREVCEMLGPGPGKEGRPLYNTIQCGHEPTNGKYNEVNCPGRVEYGAKGCKYIGPKFNFDGIVAGTLPPPTDAPVKAPTNAPTKSPVAQLPPPPSSPIVELLLIYTPTGEVAKKLNLGGANVDVSGYPTEQFNIQAIVERPLVQSVFFSNGKTESSLPFAYCGNKGLTYFPCGDLTAGQHSVTVTPYTEKDKKGTALQSVTATFTIV